MGFLATRSSAKVVYSCAEASERWEQGSAEMHYIHTVHEDSTCQYSIEFKTTLLCPVGEGPVDDARLAHT